MGFSSSSSSLSIYIHIFGASDLVTFSYLIYWQLGAWSKKYRELEHEGHIIMGYAPLPLRVTTQDDITFLVGDPELNYVYT